MKFDVIPTEQFEKDVQYYKKKKKYRNIMEDVDEVVKELSNGNLLGDLIPGLVFDNDETIKVRIANSDTNVGKSNGYRLIYYVIKNDYLLTIYYKKEDNNVPTNSEIEQLVKEYCL